jgi:hypothetical protein
MNTSIPNISKPYLLDEFLSYAGFFVHLFVNDVVGDENPIVFEEPTFEGYSISELNKNKWNVSVLNVNYATCDYGEAVVFNNKGNISTQEIYGYYVTNESGENLWYEKFNSPKIINVEEGIAVKIKVNLNKPASGFNFVSFVLSSSDPLIVPIKSSSISIELEGWNGSPVPGSLIDITNRDFNTNNSIITLLLKSNITPTEEYPYTFNYLIQSDGFNNLIGSGSITNSAATSFNVTLAAKPPTTPPPDSYSTGDSIILFGPFDTKTGMTLSSFPDSSFSFNYLVNSEFSFPANMMIFINETQVASVDYWVSYLGQPFIFQFQEYVLNGIFQSPKVFFTVDPPGPSIPSAN